jgi:hypothetical protein
MTDTWIDGARLRWCPVAGFRIRALGGLMSSVSIPRHPDEHRPEHPILLAVDQQLGRMLLSAMLFDPNRWPKPNDMLGSPKRMAIAWAILIAVAIALLIALPALADWLSRSN